MTDLDTLLADDQRIRPEAGSSAGRTAVARGRVVLGREGFDRLGETPLKADLAGTAQIVGILGAKQTSRLLPFCQDARLQGLDLDVSLDEAEAAVEIRAYAKAAGPVGVEMEALTAVSVAALAVYDLCRSVAREAVVTDVRLVAKTGGQSGDYRRTD